MNITSNQTSKSDRIKWLMPVSAALMFFIGFEVGALQFVLLGVTYEFALGGAAVGTLLATQYFALMIGQPIFAVFADRIGKKPVILVSMSLFIAGCATIAGAPIISVFVVGVFVAGMGYGVTEALICAVLVDVYPDKAERYTNLTQSLFSFGAVIGPLAASGFSSFANARLIFLVAALGFVVLLPLFGAIPLQKACLPKDKPKLTLRGGPVIPFVALMLAIFIYGGVETSAAGFLNSLFSQALYTPEFGAFAISAFWLAMMVSRVLFGVVRLPAKWVVLGCMAAWAVIFVILFASHSPALSLLFAALAGIAAGPVWAMLISFGAKEFPAYSGTAVSLMAMSSGLGATLVPIIVGRAADSLSLHFAMLVISAAMLISVFAFVVYLKRKAAQ